MTRRTFGHVWSRWTIAAKGAMSNEVIEVRIAVGRFVLQVGGPHGTSVTRGTQLALEPRDALAQGLSEPAESGTAVAATAVSDLVQGAEEVTSALERLNDLVTAIAKGLTLDPKTLRVQLDAMLDIFDRADREGRFDDEIKLARSLVVLLALVGRGVALFEVLRRTASAAAAVGDRAGEAWAHHEFGSFALAADQTETAGQYLNMALAERNALGDADGAAVTLHNLQLAQAILPRPGPDSDTRENVLRRHPVIAAAALGLLLALGGGAIAYAIVDGQDDEGRVVPTTESTASSATTETDKGQPADEPPTVTIAAAPLASKEVELTAQAADDNGVESVAFVARLDGASDDILIGTDESESFSVSWDTVAVDDGSYTVRAIATDDAGNNASATAQTTVDNTGPFVDVDKAPAMVFKGDAVKVSGTADDGSGSGITTVVIRFRRESADWQNWPEAIIRLDQGRDFFQADLPTDEMKSGDYEIQALATDEAKNSRSSEARPLEVTPQVE